VGALGGLLTGALTRLALAVARAAVAIVHARITRGHAACAWIAARRAIATIAGDRAARTATVTRRRGQCRTAAARIGPCIVARGCVRTIARNGAA